MKLQCNCLFIIIVSSTDSVHVLLDLISVNHDIRLSERFSVSVSAVSWFTLCLCDRSQSFNFAGQRHLVSSGLQCSSRAVLGPFECIAYIEEVDSVSGSHGLHHQLFADFTQLFGRCAQSILHIRFTSPVALIMLLQARLLQLNGGKSEVAWFG